MVAFNLELSKVYLTSLSAHFPRTSSIHTLQWLNFFLKNLKTLIYIELLKRSSRKRITINKPMKFLLWQAWHFPTRIQEQGMVNLSCGEEWSLVGYTLSWSLLVFPFFLYMGDKFSWLGTCWSLPSSSLQNLKVLHKLVLHTHPIYLNCCFFIVFYLKCVSYFHVLDD